MRRRSADILALLLLAALAASLSACGSGANLLPGTTASQINENLDQVRNLAAEGECNGAEEAADEVAVQVEEVSGVDPQLKSLLDEGAERLNQVVGNCEEAESEEEPLESEEETESEEGEEEAAEHEKTEKTTPKETEPPEPPGQEGENGNGKAKGHETETPPEETGGEAASGGLGPGTAVEGE